MDAGLQRELALRDDLLAMLAHELRNPLHALSLQLALARLGAERGDLADTLGRIGKAQRSLERYADRVTVLLDLVGRREGYPSQPGMIDPADVLADVVDALTPEARYHQVTLHYERPDGPARTCLDPLVLEQIVENLLLNAFKHSSGTDVHLRLSRLDEGWHVLEVADNGRGISVEDQERVFAKHEVAGNRDKASGTGLGLWIVRRLCEVLGGSVALYSGPGQGCRFTVRFPSAPPTQEER